MVRAVVLSGVLGFLLLATLAVAVGDVKATSEDASPVAFVLSDVLGPSIEKIFLAFICVSIFCCGMICLATGSRLCWAMARDRRLPGHQLLSQVPRMTGGPTWATLAMAGVGLLILFILRTNTTALIDLFTASTLSPALLYTGTVLLYAGFSHRVTPEPGYFHLGRWERPVLTGAFVWLAYELVILFGPAQFRTAQTYVAGALVVGLVFFGIMWSLEPAAMRTSVVDERRVDVTDLPPDDHDARETVRTNAMW
ncbi:MAG TPA: amino acid permease [Actinomycetes bacterium]|jgi:amino acid transporter|nr:amino acid permease [Actinomycetes bacterium]